MNGRSLKIIDGTGNPDLAEKIGKELGMDVNGSTALVSEFSDGETRVEIHDNMRGCDVFVIQPICPPHVNTNFMRLCLILDALKRSDCWRITAVIPYFGYARQDKKLQPRIPISARALADMIQAVGVNRVLTMDLHSSQVQGFFNCPVDNLFASTIFEKHMSIGIVPEETKIISPDVGGVARSVHYSKRLGVGAAIIHKSRETPNSVSEMILLGSVRDKTVVIVDDMIDTATTLCKGAEILKDAGAKKILAYATHGVFSGDALLKIDKSAFDEVYVTDSIPYRGRIGDEPDKIKVVSCAILFGKAIRNIHDETSVSCLFPGKDR